MNILIIGNCITAACLKQRQNEEYFHPAGTLKQLLLATELEAMGHSVDICSASFSKHINTVCIEYYSQGIRIIHSPTLGIQGRSSFFKRWVSSLYAMYWLRKNIQKYQCVVFYNFHMEFSAPALMGKWLFNKKVIMDYEDGLYLDRGYQGWLYRGWEKKVYRHVSRYILVNEGLKTRIIAAAPEDEKKFVTVHGLINADVLGAHSLDTEGPVQRILFSGNFSKKFGFDELLKYVDNLDGGIIFDITGRAAGPEEEKLRQRVARCPNIRYHGFLEDKAFKKIIEKADAFVLLNDRNSPYNKTNFPSKFFEYLSKNKFIITTANPLLSPYLGMKNIILLENFPEDVKKLKSLTQDRKTCHDEIVQLGQGIRSALERILH